MVISSRLDIDIQRLKIFAIMIPLRLLMLLSFLLLCTADWIPLMENPSLFEGDIELTIDQKSKLNSYASTRKGLYKHWPIGEPIPYEIDQDFLNSTWHRIRIEKALADYEKETCLRFTKRKTGEDKESRYLKFVPGGGCSSPVGMQWYGNYIRLATGCFYQHGVLLHEIAHSLGFWHEQNRPDRDNYVKIHLDRLKCCASQFRKMTHNQIDSLGFPYDYESMMHYSATAFGNGNGPVIEVLNKSMRIGNRRGFSKIDIAQINKMYHCGETHTKKPVVTKATTKTVVATTEASTTNPVSGYCIKHATSGKYLSRNSNGALVYTKVCHTKFSDLQKMKIVGSSLCAVLQGINNGNYINFESTCKDSYTLRKEGNLFSIQHVTTSKCIHPKGGSINPKDGTLAVIYSGCDYSRLRFSLEGSLVTSPTTPVLSTGFIIRHNGGLCLSVSSNNRLIFSRSCSSKFILTNDGLFREYQSKKCASPENNNSNSYVNINDQCKESFRKTQVSGQYFAIQHVRSSKCIHARGGSSYPKDGTLAVIYHSCGGKRLQFKME